MFVLRRVPPPLLAAAVFVLCLGLGTAISQGARWLAWSAATAQLTLSVQSGERDVRVVNLTDDAWEGCVVSVEGGWQSPPFAIQPHGVERLAYDQFVSDTTSNGHPSFAQAFHETAIRCRDDEGHWQDAAVR